MCLWVTIIKCAGLYGYKFKTIKHRSSSYTFKDTTRSSLSLTAHKIQSTSGLAFP